MASFATACSRPRGSKYHRMRLGNNANRGLETMPCGDVVVPFATLHMDWRFVGTFEIKLLWFGPRVHPMASCAQRRWNDTETGDCSSNGTDSNRCNNTVDKDGKQCVFQGGSCKTSSATCPKPVIDYQGIGVGPWDHRPYGRYYGICPQRRLTDFNCMNDVNKTEFVSRDELCPNLYDLYPDQSWGEWKPLVARGGSEDYGSVMYYGFSDFGNACNGMLYMTNAQQQARNNMFYGINWHSTHQNTIGYIRPKMYANVDAAISGKRNTYKGTLDSTDDMSMQSLGGGGSFFNKKESTWSCSRCPAGFVVSGVRTYRPKGSNNDYQPSSVQVICKDALNMTQQRSSTLFVGDGTFSDPHGADGVDINREQRCDTYVTGFAFNGDVEMNGMHIRCATDDEYNAFLQARSTYKFLPLDATCVGIDTQDPNGGNKVATETTIADRADSARQARCAQFAANVCSQPNADPTYCECLHATVYKADLNGTGDAAEIPRHCVSCMNAHVEETWMDYRYAHNGNCPKMDISNCVVQNTIKAGGTVTLDHNQVTQNCNNSSQINVGEGTSSSQPTAAPATPPLPTPSDPLPTAAPATPPLPTPSDPLPTYTTPLPPLSTNPFEPQITVPPTTQTPTPTKSKQQFIGFVIILLLLALAYYVVA